MKLVAKLFLLSSAIFLSVQTVEAKKRKQYFNQTEFNVDFKVTHPIVTGDFLDKPNNEILIMGEDEEKNKVAAIYAFSEEQQSYIQHLIFEIPESVLAFDYLTDQNGFKKLILLSVNQLSIFDFNQNKFSKLTDISSLYLKENPQFIAKKKLVEDFNGDGLDDVIVSDFSQINLLLQQSDGKFKFNKLSIKPKVDMNRQEITFWETNVFHADVNFDGKMDLVVIENGNIQFFEQLESGVFNHSKKELILPMNVNKLEQRLIRGSDGQREDQSDSKHRMVEKLEDINGDGIVDIMLFEAVSSGVFDKKNAYEIFYGSNNNGVLEFDASFNTVITSDETLTGLKLVDLNSNNKKEVLVSSFDIGVSQIIGAILSGSVDQGIHVFSLNDKNNYSKEPVFSEEVDLSFSLSSGSSGEPVGLTADLNGDGFKELVLSSGEKKLAIYRGIEDKSLFNDSEKRHRLLLPKQGSMIIISDLNNDKKQELIVRYGKQDKKELRNKVIILKIK